MRVSKHRTALLAITMLLALGAFAPAAMAAHGAATTATELLVGHDAATTSATTCASATKRPRRRPLRRETTSSTACRSPAGSAARTRPSMTTWMSCPGSSDVLGRARWRGRHRRLHPAARGDCFSSYTHQPRQRAEREHLNNCCTHRRPWIVTAGSGNDDAARRLPEHDRDHLRRWRRRPGEPDRDAPSGPAGTSSTEARARTSCAATGVTTISSERVATTRSSVAPATTSRTAVRATTSSATPRRRASTTTTRARTRIAAEAATTHSSSRTATSAGWRSASTAGQRRRGRQRRLGLRVDTSAPRATTSSEGTRDPTTSTAAAATTRVTAAAATTTSKAATATAPSSETPGTTCSKGDTGSTGSRVARAGTGSSAYMDGCTGYNCDFHLGDALFARRRGGRPADCSGGGTANVDQFDSASRPLQHDQPEERRRRGAAAASRRPASAAPSGRSR